jgi:hypothetical protein
MAGTAAPTTNKRIWRETTLRTARRVWPKDATGQDADLTMATSGEATVMAWATALARLRGGSWRSSRGDSSTAAGRHSACSRSGGRRLAVGIADPAVRSQK